MRRGTIALVAGALLLTLAPAASAGTVTLHPSGFGEHSYAAWKSQEGLPDSRGTKEQFLYLQKMTSTATVAAGVAVFKGLEGVDSDELLPLEFWYQSDTYCGAGAPRFNVRIETAPGMRQTVFVGCQAMLTTGGTVDDQGDPWTRKTFAGPLPAGEVVSLSIVFDEGNDLGPTSGFVYLDNIRVGQYLWTSASYNGQNNAVDAAEAETILTEPFRVALGLR
jgi:hypothetical protein